MNTEVLSIDRDEHGRLVLLPIFRGAMAADCDEIAHGTFAELLKRTAKDLVVSEALGHPESMAAYFACSRDQLAEMVRSAAVSCCHEPVPTWLWSRLLDTARKMAAENNLLTEIVTHLEGIK